MQMAMATKNDIQHLYTSELKTKINVKGYNAEYGLNKNELGQLGEILGGLIGSNQDEFIKRLTPSLEEAISKWLLSISNNIFKIFSYEQLFPDRI